EAGAFQVSAWPSFSDTGVVVASSAMVIPSVFGPSPVNPCLSAHVAQSRPSGGKSDHAVSHGVREHAAQFGENHPQVARPGGLAGLEVLVVHRVRVIAGDVVGILVPHHDDLAVAVIVE